MSLEGKSRTNKAYRLSVGDPGEIRTGTDQLGTQQDSRHRDSQSSRKRTEERRRKKRRGRRQSEEAEKATKTSPSSIQCSANSAGSPPVGWQD